MALHKKNYNVQDETWQTQEQFYDKHLLKMVNADLAASGRVVVRAPEMKGGTTIVTLPYPEFPTDGSKPTKVLPDRWDTNPENPRSYNRWLFIAADKGVIRFGKQWISVLFDNPEDSGWDFDTDHPIQLIHRHTDFAVRKNIDVQTPYGSASSDNWTVLVKGDKSKNEFEIIKRPEVMFLAYAVIYHSGKNSYFRDTGAAYGSSSNDPLVVFVMSRSTGVAFMDEIDKPIMTNKPSEGLLHPTVTGSRYVHYYDKQLGSCPMVQSAAAATPAGDEFGTRRGPQARVGEQAPTGFGYAVALSETIDGMPQSRKVNRDAVTRYALNRVLPWEKVIRGHTPEECAELVQSMAQLPMSVLAHAWQSHPEYLNETTKAMMANRVTSAPSPKGPPPSATTNRRSELDDFDFNAGADVPPVATEQTLPFVNPVPSSAPPATGSEDLYSPARLQAAQDKLRAAMTNQTQTGSVPTIPSPPTFRKPGSGS